MVYTQEILCQASFEELRAVTKNASQIFKTLKQMLTWFFVELLPQHNLKNYGEM